MAAVSALLITRDQTLLDDVRRLAAAAGLVLDVADDGGSAVKAWGTASAVLVGDDQAAAMAGRPPVRRDQVHVVSRGPVDDALFRDALLIGAADVLELPSAESWLVELLTDVADGGAVRATTIGVVGGSGGAGATTFACALATVAAHEAPTLLIDLDLLGPGVDRVVGFDEVAGVAWETLMESRGRLGSRSLRDALPQRDRLAVLTWAAATARPLRETSVLEVLAAAQRGNDVVVVDLPRHRDPVAVEVVARCDHVVLVAGGSVTAVAAAGRVVAELQEVARSVQLVVRGGSAGLPPDAVSRTLGVPLAASMADQRRLAEHVDLSLGPVHSRRGPLAKAARTVCARLVTAPA